MEDKQFFLQETMRLIEVSDSDPKIVYAYWQNNIKEINKQLLEFLPNFSSTVLRNSENDKNLISRFYFFGHLVSQFQHGNIEINIELSLYIFKICYSFCKRLSSPSISILAHIQSYLGYAYTMRIKGDKQRNTKYAIFYYIKSLELYSKELNPFEYANNLFNIAELFLRCTDNNKSENVEYSIQCNEIALEIISYEKNPIFWAKIHSTLADTYRQKESDFQENIKSSIYHYNACLNVYNRLEHPIDWANAKYQLGILYSDLIENDSKVNFEYIITHLTDSLEIITHDKYPEEWAIVQTKLAFAYGDIDRCSDKNLITSMGAYRGCGRPLKEKGMREFSYP